MSTRLTISFREPARCAFRASRAALIVACAVAGLGLASGAAAQALDTRRVASRLAAPL